MTFGCILIYQQVQAHTAASPIQAGSYEYFVLVTDWNLLPPGYPLCSAQSSIFSLLQHNPLFWKIAFIHHLVVWGIDQSDVVGWQMEIIHIMPPWHPSPCHKRFFPPLFAQYSGITNYFGSTSLPVFWSSPGYNFPASSRFQQMARFREELENWRTGYHGTNVNQISNWSMTFLAFQNSSTQCNKSLIEP